jgi:FAD/FMN-containing dehydrogenase
MIDCRPSLIARCSDVADVIAALRFACDHRLPIAVRGGGHSGPGYGTVDRGVVIDLSMLRGVRVDPAMRTARVEGGARWGDVDHATHQFGLAVVSGLVSTTGVGGLTLGGGHGHLTRRFGLTIDNLVSADLVLADGRFVTVSESDHEDLFWAIRGGGGNFGIVTSFLFRLHPVSTVIAGPTLWPMDRAAEALDWYRNFLPTAPEELNGFFLFFEVPPGAPFPAELHGRRMAGIFWCHCGDATAARRDLEPVQKVGAPALHAVGETPYPNLQSAFDPLYGPGLQWYWRGHFLRDISDEAIDINLAFSRDLPSPLSTTHLYPIDGAVHRVAADATAFGRRDARWSQVIAGIDPDPLRAPELKRWARSYSSAIEPHTSAGGYVNFLMEDDGTRIRACYGATYDRLTSLKTKYDPENLFRRNQNIEPAAFV